MDKWERLAGPTSAAIAAVAVTFLIITWDAGAVARGFTVTGAILALALALPPSPLPSEALRAIRAVGVTVGSVAGALLTLSFGWLLNNPGSSPDHTTTALIFAVAVVWPTTWIAGAQLVWIDRRREIETQKLAVDRHEAVLAAIAGRSGTSDERARPQRSRLVPAAILLAALIASRHKPDPSGRNSVTAKA